MIGWTTATLITTSAMVRSFAQASMIPATTRRVSGWRMPTPAGIFGCWMPERCLPWAGASTASPSNSRAESAKSLYTPRSLLSAFKRQAPTHHVHLHQPRDPRATNSRRQTVPRRRRWRSSGYDGSAGIGPAPQPNGANSPAAGSRSTAPDRAVVCVR